MPVWQANDINFSMPVWSHNTILKKKSASLAAAVVCLIIVCFPASIALQQAEAVSGWLFYRAVAIIIHGSSTEQ